MLVVFDEHIAFRARAREMSACPSALAMFTVMDFLAAVGRGE